MALRSNSLDMVGDARCDWHPASGPNGLPISRGSSARSSRAFSPVVGSTSPAETPSLPDNIDLDFKPASLLAPQGQQAASFDPMFSAFDPIPCLLAAAFAGSRVGAAHPAASYDPFAAFYTAPLAEQQVRTVRRDLQKYESLVVEGGGGPDSREEAGWKLVAGDVFRPPANSASLAVRPASAPNGLPISRGSSARSSRAFSPVVGSTSPAETPSLPDNIDLDFKPASLLAPQGQQAASFDPMFSAFDPIPCLLAAAFAGSRVGAAHPAASYDPFAAFYTAPLAEQQVDWGTWRPLYARGSSSGCGNGLWGRQ
ncbi:hypothetical protein HYH02_002959 [Chlamydomonas schloesseri]|uniref:Uncharacterized protein n=1 Tax=Chlamydomonas schloesseri TaxID=2026947 RepID=A0A835WRE6_9CHLO|nr:hypothetical protein HYH02_002959 [Chlamydomonas schloesseri]|eukprot:KAG2452729.1 hypothetical protein HYH02_002959 [Chlamydomonas schloesseri]